MTLQKTPFTSCPDDESLAGLIENRITDDARDQIERHLTLCPSCVDVIAAASPPGPVMLHSRSTAHRALAGALVTQTWGETGPSGRAAQAPRRLALAAAVLLVSTAAVGYLGTRVGLGFARAELARRAADTLGEPVTIGRMTLALGRDLRGLSLRLADVHVGGGNGKDPTLDADVELSIALARLWEGVVDVERIRLFEPTLRLNQPAASAQSAVLAHGIHLDTPRIATLVAGGPPIDIEAGILNLGFPGEPSLRIEQLAAHSMREGDWIQFTLAGSAAGGLVTVTGKLSAGDGRTVTVSVGGHGLELADLPYLRNLATATADVNLTVTRSSSHILVGGRVLAQQGSAPGGNPIPALLGQELRAANLAMLAPDLTGKKLFFDEARVAFVWRRGAWRISRGLVSRAGIDITGTLRAAASGELKGKAILSLPPIATDPLLAQNPALARALTTAGSLRFPFAIAGTINEPLFARRF